MTAMRKRKKKVERVPVTLPIDCHITESELYLRMDLASATVSDGRSVVVAVDASGAAVLVTIQGAPPARPMGPKGWKTYVIPAQSLIGAVLKNEDGAKHEYQYQEEER